MKVLLLVQKKQRVMLDNLYAAIKRHLDCDVFWLTSEDQANLKKWFSKNRINTSTYDRIILFIRFKKEIRQVRFIRTLPNVVILEHDASQNYSPGKYQGKFSAYYNKIPWVRILNSGFTVTEKLQQEAFDAVFVPKGYDEQMVANYHITRDIELGFIGSTENKTYSLRKDMLNALAEKENLLITRTRSGNEYTDTLNRIRFFISADIGLGEYMIKNFEAMACGCILFSWDVGRQENEALGFRDMHNLVLYSSLEELLHKLRKLREDPELAQSIAENGQFHAENNFTFDLLGKKIKQAIETPLRKKTIHSFLGIKRFTWSPP